MLFMFHKIIFDLHMPSIIPRSLNRVHWLSDVLATGFYISQAEVFYSCRGAFSEWMGGQMRRSSVNEIWFIIKISVDNSCSWILHWLFWAKDMSIFLEKISSRYFNWDVVKNMMAQIAGINSNGMSVMTTLQFWREVRLTHLHHCHAGNYTLLALGESPPQRKVYYLLPNTLCLGGMFYSNRYPAEWLRLGVYSQIAESANR